MATNEGTALDLSAVTEAGGMVIALVQAVVLVIPLLTVAMLLLSHLRHHDRSRTSAPLWCSRTTAGTRYLLGEISHAEYRRATASNHRVRSALR